MRISDWSSDVCSSDLLLRRLPGGFELGGPVLLDLADQLRRQRHVVEFGCLLLAVLQRPGEELAGRCAAPRVGRLFVHQDEVGGGDRPRLRSEEHTSELQSLMRISYAVFCLKKQKTDNEDKV